MDTKLLFLDLETSGLSVDNRQIIEVACTFTDTKFRALDSGVSFVVHTNEDEWTLDHFDAWALKMHTENGLRSESLASAHSLADVERGIIKYIEEHGQGGNKIRTVLAGYNVATFDFLFLRKYMPNLEGKFLSYRHFDVSTIELFWNLLQNRGFSPVYVNIHNAMPPSKHRAGDDVASSISVTRFIFEALYGDDGDASTTKRRCLKIILEAQHLLTQLDK